MNLALPLLPMADPQGLRNQQLMQRLRRAGIPVRLCEPPASACLHLELIRADGRLRCRVDANAWAAVHLPGLQGLDWTRLDYPVMEGLLAGVTPLQLSGPGLAYERCRLLQVPDPPAPGPALPCIHSREGDVWLEQMDWCLPAAATAGPLPSRLRVRLQLHAGRLRLPLRRLRRLRPGDIVLLAEVQLRGCVGARPLFEFELLPEAITVTMLHTLQDDAAAASPGAAMTAPTAPTLDLSQLPLTLEVRLGELQLSLADLSSLQPGVVLPLPPDAHQRVQVAHAGQCVATGVLVQVGDALGVRLAQVPRLA